MQKVTVYAGVLLSDAYQVPGRLMSCWVSACYTCLFPARNVIDQFITRYHVSVLIDPSKEDGSKVTYDSLTRSVFMFGTIEDTQTSSGRVVFCSKYDGI